MDLYNRDEYTFCGDSGITLLIGGQNYIYRSFHDETFSLDIEGGEFQVLKTIPWDKVNKFLLEQKYYTLPKNQRFSFMKSLTHTLETSKEFMKCLFNGFYTIKPKSQ